MSGILISSTILAPLLAAIFILILRKHTYELTLLAAGTSLLASLGLLFSSGGELVFPGLPNMPFQLIASPLTSLLSTLVGVISLLVLIYATGYMAKDTEKNRFFAIMLLFVAAMQLLVLAGDWILLLTAWELIGFSSYLLIGFWYQQPGVKSASSRAFLVTRSADLGLYIAVFVLIASTGSSSIASTLNTEDSAATVAGFLLLVAAMGKSAQSPFHDWLQRAMAGPTPVSALLHSATLVAAGAILLIRTAPMLPEETLTVIGIVGGLTALITGLIALAETDLKRLLAASTSSQYGLMLLAIGAGIPMAALFHLIAHAAIKSSLFLGAGVFQHSRESTAFDDLQRVGRDHPRIFCGFAIAALALAGIPPLSGFFSKDAIIAATMASSNAWLFAPLALIGTVLTGAYMARALKILWQAKNEDERKQKTPGGLKYMGAGIAGLVTLVIILGMAFSSIESSIGNTIDTSAAIHATENWMAEIFGLSAAICGLLLGWFIPISTLLGPLQNKASQGFSIAGGFDALCVRPALAIAQRCEKLEIRLYNLVLAFGNMGMKLGKLTRRSDEEAIDRFIFSFVGKTIDTGNRSRVLQNGLIHRELAVTTIVTAALFVATFLGLFFYY